MPEGLFVIGAGQMRTGTTTLKDALEALYDGKCYHMDEIIHKKQNHINIWNQVLDQGTLDKEIAKIIFDDYFAAVDNPAATFYDDLMNIYPNSKIILTTRNAKDWVKSVRNTTFRKPSFLWDLFERLSFYSYGMSGFIEMCQKLRCKSFDKKYEVLQNDDEALAVCFEKYNERVRTIVPKERLLEFDLEDGWKPLCEFLNLPIPDKPFPHLNNTRDFQRIYKNIYIRFLFRCGVLLGCFVGGAVWFLRKRIYI